MGTRGPTHTELMELEAERTYAFRIQEDPVDFDHPNGDAVVPPYVFPTLPKQTPAGASGAPHSQPRPLRSVEEPLARRLKRRFGGYLHVYTLCSLFASLGGFLFGFDTGSIGPVIVMPAFVSQFHLHSPVLQGLVVSTILLTASLASLFAGVLSDRISRTRTFAIGGAVFSIGSVLCASASSLPMLIFGRSVAGIGEGLFLSTVTVYTLEIAPTQYRGRLSCITQLYAVVAATFAVGSLALPHSPRWLQHVGRTEDAARAWARLGFTAAEAEKEQEVVQRVEREEAQADVDAQDVGVRPEEARAAEKRATWIALWDKDVRRRTVLGIFIMAMHQYAPVIFSQAGLSSKTSAFLASGVSGLLTIVCVLVTQIFTDRWGRRTSMIRGGSVIAATMLLIGTIYASGASATPAGRWTVIALIYIFLVAFHMSWAVVNRIYCSEIQPMRTRAAATSLGQCANWAVNWIIAFSTPLFLSKSSSGPYFLFGTCSLVTVVVCVLFQPESRGVSLEGLDAIFEVSPWRKFLARRARHGHEDVYVMRAQGI
ncbi:hypothetical protein FA95DRAFT_1560430 [Auriscalpium vulgare]|uniref:Uncharacterized protein n=1 Tax=Auriscalpium vulgare TaxID=40419 RepID=A0ACB8RRN0_9AGAM|nr:hypothetical protein FA95DRAFT_1560430 [Auriscalpium vulgare]